MENEKTNKLIWKAVMIISLMSLLVAVILLGQQKKNPEAIMKTIYGESPWGPSPVPIDFKFKYFRPIFVIGAAALSMITVGVVTGRTSNILIRLPYILLQVGLILVIVFGVLNLIRGSNFVNQTAQIFTGIGEFDLLGYAALADKLKSSVTWVTVIGHITIWSAVALALVDTVFDLMKKDSSKNRVKTVTSTKKAKSKTEIEELQEKVEIAKLKREELALMEEAATKEAKIKAAEAAKIAKLKEELAELEF